MEEMIGRWLAETRIELQKAKNNQNLLKMKQMYRLETALIDMKAKLLNL